MILPKGVVVNTKNIYKEVADFQTVPLDKVFEYWHGTGYLDSLLPLQDWLTPRSVHNHLQEATGSYYLPTRELLVACLG